MEILNTIAASPRGWFLCRIRSGYSHGVLHSDGLTGTGSCARLASTPEVRCTMREEEPKHAREMPAHVAQIAAALPLRLVDDDGHRAQHHAPATGWGASAEVEVR